MCQCTHGATTPSATTPEYEYHLAHWGEVMNADQRWLEKELGITARDHWFPSKQERDAFRLRLASCAKSHGCTIAFSEHEGLHVRLRTIARMTMRLHDGRTFNYAHDFGYGYEPHSARFMWHEGNYACDCNRSLFLCRAGYPVEEMDCGETITLEHFRVTCEP